MLTGFATLVQIRRLWQAFAVGKGWRKSGRPREAHTVYKGEIAFHGNQNVFSKKTLLHNLNDDNR